MARGGIPQVAPVPPPPPGVMRRMWLRPHRQRQRPVPRVRRARRLQGAADGPTGTVILLYWGSTDDSGLFAGSSFEEGEDSPATPLDGWAPDSAGFCSAFSFGWLVGGSLPGRVTFTDLASIRVAAMDSESLRLRASVVRPSAFTF